MRALRWRPVPRPGRRTRYASGRRLPEGRPVVWAGARLAFRSPTQGRRRRTERARGRCRLPAGQLRSSLLPPLQVRGGVRPDRWFVLGWPKAGQDRAQSRSLVGAVDGGECGVEVGDEVLGGFQADGESDQSVFL